MENTDYNKIEELMKTNNTAINKSLKEVKDTLENDKANKGDLDAVTKKLDAIEADNKETADAFEKELADMKAMAKVKNVQLSAKEIRQKCYINAIHLAMTNKTNADGDVLENLNKEYGVSENEIQYNKKAAQTNATAETLIPDPVFRGIDADPEHRSSFLTMAGSPGVFNGDKIKRLLTDASGAYWQAGSGSNANATTTHNNEDITQDVGKAVAKIVIDDDTMQDIGVTVQDAFINPVTANLNALVEKAAIDGTGAGGQMRGILNGTKRASGTPFVFATHFNQFGEVTSAASRAITLDDLTSLQAQVHENFRAGAYLVMNSATFFALSRSKGTDQHFQLPMSVVDGQYNIMGMRVFIDENMPSVAANNNAVAYINPSMGYTYYERRGLTVKVVEDDTARRLVFTKRVAGTTHMGRAGCLLKVKA